MKWPVFSLLIWICQLTESSSTDDSYVAAVVEFEINHNTTENLEHYLKFIEEAAKQKADIIVFPECTLTRSLRTVPVPILGLLKHYPIPAQKPKLYDEILVSLSRAAMEYKIYVVVNLAEEVNCKLRSEEYCPEKKIYHFNTNVVFDRRGAVIDRYRKINLFGEPGVTPALRPDLGVFTTDFGVTFGHFICFDLMFQVPAVQIVQNTRITDIIFSTMWFSELPYLTAIEIQQSYAYSMDVNLLASGANKPEVGTAGSGLYSGKAEAITSIMPGSPTSRLLIANMPKTPGNVTKITPGPIHNKPSEQDNLKLKTDPSLVDYVTKLLEAGNQQFTLVNNDVTCNFKIKMTDNNVCNTVQQYRYRAGAHDGIRSFTFKNGAVRSCSVFACTGPELKDCGHRFPHYNQNSTGVFEELTITSTFPLPKFDVVANDSSYFPVSLDTTLMPLASNQYKYTVRENKKASRITFTMTLNTGTKNSQELYSFGVWGRVYPRDIEANTEVNCNI